MTILPRIFPPSVSRPAPTTRELRGKSGRFNFSGAFDNILSHLQKYQDIPRRFQRQWLTTFLACLLLVGVISGIYLNVTARAAIAGREIQNLETEIITNQRLNADLQTRIAGTLSNVSLEERATAAGFVPLTRDNIKYLVVPGYIPAQEPAVLSAAPAEESKKLPDEYSETLFTWLARQLDAASTPLTRTH